MGVGFAIPKTPEGQEPPPVVPPKKKPSWIEKAGL
jgi:hypothetical protein